MPQSTDINILHRTYNGPLPSDERMMALFGSSARYAESKARAMIHHYASESLKIANRIFSRTGEISIPELNFLLGQRRKWREYLDLTH